MNDTHEPSEVIEHLGVRLELGPGLAFRAGKALALTGTELRILATLLKNPGKVFSRIDLMKSAIAGGAVVLERTIDVHIAALRRKLGSPDPIETVRLRGYRAAASV